MAVFIALGIIAVKRFHPPVHAPKFPVDRGDAYEVGKTMGD
jgi:hypothetical protein